VRDWIKSNYLDFPKCSHYDFDKNCRTALIWACKKSLSDIAIELIKTNQSKPDNIDSNGDTALIWACQNSLSDIAVELIKTNQSKPNHINSNGKSSLTIARTNKLHDVVSNLKPLTKLKYFKYFKCW
jgi:ankyrin repeat protein